MPGVGIEGRGLDVRVRAQVGIEGYDARVGRPGIMQGRTSGVVIEGRGMDVGVRVPVGIEGDAGWGARV